MSLSNYPANFLYNWREMYKRIRFLFLSNYPTNFLYNWREMYKRFGCFVSLELSYQLLIQLPNMLTYFCPISWHNFAKCCWHNFAQCCWHIFAYQTTQNFLYNYLSVFKKLVWYSGEINNTDFLYNYLSVFKKLVWYSR